MKRLVAHVLALSLRTTTTKWLLLASLVGLIGGVVGLVFYWATEVGISLILTNPDLVGYPEVVPDGELRVSNHPHHTGSTADISPFWLLTCLTLGGLASGLLIHFGSQAAAGAGTGSALQAFHHDNGRIRLRTSVTKFFATLCTYCTGGSAGREGPIVLIVAGLASTVGRWLHVSSRDRRILLAAGIAAGVSALFRAPLAGAFFAAEVLYRDPDVESDVLIPGFISSVVAYCTFGVLYAMAFPGAPGDGVFLANLYATPDLSFAVGDIGQLLGYLIVVAGLMLVARFHIFCTRTVELHIHRVPGPPWLRPAAGALATGVVALLILYGVWGSGLVDREASPQLAVLGAGYGIVQQALDGAAQMSVPMTGLGMMALLLVVAFGKAVTNACTVASGGSGGTFGPSIVVGGCTGGAIGLALAAIPGLPPALVPEPAACVIMGMAGYLAVAYKAPVTALLMITDLTGNFSLLLPGMLVCTLAYLFGGRAALVHGQVGSPLESPAHRGHFFNDILADLKVQQVFDPQREVHRLSPSSSIDDCKQLVTASHQSVYPVVDDDGHLCGIFNLNDLRSFLYDDTLGLVAVAQDVATTDLITVNPGDSLARALRCFTDRNLEELPVVDDQDRFLGLLTRRQVIASYNQVVEELRAQRRAEGYEDDRSGERPAIGE